jgi:hypothetical protein
MRWMNRRPRGERGAVATLVAVLLGGGVLLGMTALTVDVGQIFSERRELQNGADAAALAVAQDCAEGESCDTGTGSGSLAGTFADDNARKDGAADVRHVCGNGASLPGCPAPEDSIYDCPAPPASGVTYVEVKTATKEAGGSTLLPPTFARALAGNESYDGVNVYACARAGWGAPRSVTSALPVTFSLCEWNNATANGTNYAPSPETDGSYPAGYPTSYEHMIYLHDTKGLSGCPSGPSGSDLPGGFGWLDSDGCEATVDENSWVYDDPGVSINSDCKDKIDDLVGTTVFLPVFDETNGLSGANGEYHIRGFAAFYLTGYNLPAAKGNPQASVATGAKCKGSEKCLIGWFTQGLVDVGTAGGSGPPMGASAVSLID